MKPYHTNSDWRRILGVLHESKFGASTRHVAIVTGMKMQQVYGMLYRMKDKSLVERKSGVWHLLITG